MGRSQKIKKRWKLKVEIKHATTTHISTHYTKYSKLPEQIKDQKVTKRSSISNEE